MRPIMSIVLPAENGTMARIGFAAGQAACAKLEPASAGAPRMAAESFRKLRRLCAGMFPPECACLSAAGFRRMMPRLWPGGKALCSRIALGVKLGFHPRVRELALRDPIVLPSFPGRHGRNANADFYLGSRPPSHSESGGHGAMV